MKISVVQLFATCLVEAIRPQAGLAVVAILERLGLTVEYPDGQTCCGQPAFNAGGWADARAMARYTLDMLSRSPASIIIPSGSCPDMIIHHYPELLADDPKYGPLAQDIASRTYEFTQFIVEVMGVTDLPGLTRSAALRGAPQDPAGLKHKIAYHPSCHLLRGLNNRTAPKQLLAGVNAEIVDIPNAEECCGFGGLFAIKMSDISGAMLQRKLDNIESTGAETVVGCDVSCLLHIGGGLHRRGASIETKHLAELFANTE